MSLISFWIIFYTMQLLWENLEKMFHSFKPHHPSTISRETEILVNTITLTFYGTTQNSPLKLLSGKSFKRWNYFHHTIFVWFFTERWCENQTWMNERPTKTEWKFSTQKRKRKYPFAHWNDPRIQSKRQKNSTKSSPIFVDVEISTWFEGSIKTCGKSIFRTILKVHGKCQRTFLNESLLGLLFCTHI